MIIYIIFGFILSVVGILGCILPVIPGPPLNFIALILLEIAKDGTNLSMNTWIFWGVVTVLVSILDYIVPVAGAKKFGASRAGIWGSVIGLLLGLLVFPPFGMFFGAFIGAVAGEIAVGKKKRAALKAGMGTFVGTMIGIGLKLAASIGMTFYFVKALVL